MLLSQFQYHLPEHLIAQYPLERRDASRLLHLTDQGENLDRKFTDLPTLLRPGDLLVLNDTSVIPGRLFGTKQSGGKVEFMLERVIGTHNALGHLRSSKAKRLGSLLHFGDPTAPVSATIKNKRDNLFELEFSKPIAEWIDQAGSIPLPPYIKRQPEELDRERYQTVFAKNKGAVAAPTAGLHFQPETLDLIRAKGVEVAWVTLHVGAGTFQPVREEEVRKHKLHSEYLEVSPALCAAVERTKKHGGRVVAVGTTSLRSLETAAQRGELNPFKGETDLFILPGYKFNVVDALLTNFHLPGSTLLMLVCAFGGYHRMMQAYEHAVAQEYRFFSYGDAMFLNLNTRDGE